MLMPLKCSQGGASLQHRPQGWSLLHVSAAMGQASAVKWLLSHKLSLKGEALLGHIWLQAYLISQCKGLAKIMQGGWKGNTSQTWHPLVIGIASISD